MTSDDARDWLRLFNDLPEGISYECKHGHADCSTTREGECLDEVLKASHTGPGFEPLLPAQRLAAEKARREMGDTEEGC